MPDGRGWLFRAPLGPPLAGYEERAGIISGHADAVITFASQAKETDWLHQNDLAQAGGAVTGSGYVGLIVGNLWIVPSGSGVVGPDDLQSALAPIGGKESTSF